MLTPLVVAFLLFSSSAPISGALTSSELTSSAFFNITFRAAWNGKQPFARSVFFTSSSVTGWLQKTFLAAQRNPNRGLPGILLLSNRNEADALRASDLKLLENIKAPLGARDVRGRLLYSLHLDYQTRELVLEDKAGRKLGGFEFFVYAPEIYTPWATLSPDGKRVALYFLCPGSLQTDKLTRDCLAVTDLNGEKTRILARTLNIAINGGPAAWTPDGRILYSGKDGRLYISDSSFKRETRLTQREGRFPAVSPNGKKVAYISGNGLYTLNLDGGNVQKIDQGDNASLSLSSPTWSPDGKALLTLVSNNVNVTALWLNPLEGGRKGYNLTDAQGRVLNFYGIQRLSWWAGK